MRRRHRLAAGAFAIATASLLGGIAWAAIPGDGGIVQGCYDSGGNLKVLASRWPGIKRAHRGHKGSKARRGTKATAESEGYPAPTIRMGRRAPMAKTALLVLRA
jgi:hypothetical protein